MRELIMTRMEEIAEEHDIDIGSLSREEMDDLWALAEKSIVDRLADKADNLRKQVKEQP